MTDAVIFDLDGVLVDLSPDHLLITGKIAVNGTDPGMAIARMIDNAERRVRETVDLNCTIYLEPDIDRGT